MAVQKNKKKMNRNNEIKTKLKRFEVERETGGQTNHQPERESGRRMKVPNRCGEREAYDESESGQCAL